jgi:hypothetical protein
MTTSYDASPRADAAPQPLPAPWMPLEPLTELWAAFGREATSREALLAARSAFAALADEREAIHTLNWLVPAWPHSFPDKSTATGPASFSLLVTQEAIIEALSRAATHWFEAARALVDYAGQPVAFAGDRLTGSPELDLDALIGYTLSQRVRVWAIAHSLLAEQLQQLFPQREQGSEGAP